jgi:hypothetical protein
LVPSAVDLGVAVLVMVSPSTWAGGVVGVWVTVAGQAASPTTHVLGGGLSGGLVVGQPLCAGLVLPRPLLPSHSYPLFLSFLNWPGGVLPSALPFDPAGGGPLALPLEGAAATLACAGDEPDGAAPTDGALVADVVVTTTAGALGDGVEEVDAVAASSLCRCGLLVATPLPLPPALDLADAPATAPTGLVSAPRERIATAPRPTSR